MSLQQRVLRYGVDAVIAALPPEALRELADDVLDHAERAVQNSETKTDDAVLVPVINLVRETFNIPDND